MRFIFIVILFIFQSSIILSQVLPICGTDKVMKKYIHSDHFKNQQERISEAVNRNQMFNTKVIPIVFHIIHDGHPIGEDENVSVAQIENAVSILNEDYNTLNQDLENVVSEFQNLIGDANIEFRLAKLDPNGNCTNGINRILSNMTNQANDCIKDLIAWDDSKYVNIWVVEDIDSAIGAAAYTYLPGALWYGVEGIIINHEYLGSIGSSNNTPYKRHTLSHEFGHYFNLEHTWGWGSNGELDNCSYDDNVSDTPNTIGAYSTCNLSQISCGSLDNIQNFMDYSSCTCMFTVGQVNRMQDCLNSSVSDRNNLWTNSNLWDTGTHDNYNAEACIPNIDFFTSQVDRICANTPTTFINTSESLGSNAVFNWSFPGAENEYSSEENPTVSYTASGEYQVTLSVFAAGGENTLTKTYFVYDAPMNLNEGFENTQFPSNSDPSLSWMIQGPPNETSWTRNPLSSNSNTGSVRIRSRFFDDDGCNNKHYLYTPSLDLSNFGLGIGEPLKILFDIAYGKRTNQSDDLLIISYSRDCGNTWQERASWDTDELITTTGGNVGNNFTPNQEEWIEKSVNIQSAAEENDVIIRFEFSGERGGYLYIDNVRLTGEWIDISELDFSSSNSQILKRIDLLGRDNTNSLLYFEIYHNGEVHKKYKFR